MDFKVDTNKLTIKELIEFRRLQYEKWEPILCPQLKNELVYFNKEGFYHLTHNGRGKIRNQADQRMRLNLLPNIPTVIKKSRSFGSSIRIIPASNNKFHKEITYYELYYRFTSIKAVSVIIRKIGNGNLHFYSVRFNKK